MRMDQPARYSRPQRFLHWTMAALVLLAYLAIEQRGLFARGSAGRAAMMQSHFWLGLAILALAAWRLALRAKLAPPPVTPALPGWQHWPARLMHVALYAFFIVMPLLGLATAWTDGRDVMVPLTGWALPPLLAPDEALAETLETLHGTIGEAFYWVIGLHVAASIYHHWVRRDDTLRRML
jgi:cytochrome b561